jgi:hypothetical protein
MKDEFQFSPGFTFISTATALTSVPLYGFPELCYGIYRLENETHHSLPASAKIRNSWSLTFWPYFIV